VEQLVGLAREAEASAKSGRADEAAALIKKAQPLANRVMAVPRPTLAAATAASDVDQLYGQMLMSNGHYGWARLEFQKDVARWTHWRPQTEETAKRRKAAEAAIAECDRRMTSPGR
jgi:hypothetical protein